MVISLAEAISNSEAKTGTPGATRTHDTRFRKLSATIPNSDFTFKLELLCYLPKPVFKRKIPTGDIVFQYIY